MGLSPPIYLKGRSRRSFKRLIAHLLLLNIILLFGPSSILLQSKQMRFRIKDYSYATSLLWSAKSNTSTFSFSNYCTLAAWQIKDCCNIWYVPILDRYSSLVCVKSGLAVARNIETLLVALLIVAKLVTCPLNTIPTCDFIWNKRLRKENHSLDTTLNFGFLRRTSKLNRERC